MSKSHIFPIAAWKSARQSVLSNEQTALTASRSALWASLSSASASSARTREHLGQCGEFRLSHSHRIIASHNV